MGPSSCKKILSDLSINLLKKNATKEEVMGRDDVVKKIKDAMIKGEISLKDRIIRVTGVQKMARSGL